MRYYEKEIKLVDYDSACETRDWFINRLMMKGEIEKPKYRPILALNSLDIHNLIEVFVSTMLYAKGYYHLFDGRYSVGSWSVEDVFDDRIVISSTDNATNTVYRTDIIEHKGISKLFDEIIKSLKEYDDVYEL